MNQIVETYGRLIDGQIPEHPQRAADLMTAAYSLVGMQASHFPSKKRMASREFLQGYTAKLMTKLLKDPSDSAIVNIFMPSEGIYRPRRGEGRERHALFLSQGAARLRGGRRPEAPDDGCEHDARL